jgi:hypothetical protein
MIVGVRNLPEKFSAFFHPEDLELTYALIPCVIVYRQYIIQIWILSSQRSPWTAEVHKSIGASGSAKQEGIIWYS